MQGLTGRRGGTGGMVARGQGTGKAKDPQRTATAPSGGLPLVDRSNRPLHSRGSMSRAWSGLQAKAEPSQGEAIWPQDRTHRTLTLSALGPQPIATSKDEIAGKPTYPKDSRTRYANGTTGTAR